MLTIAYAKREISLILLLGGGGGVLLLIVGWWIAALVMLAAMLLLLCFFRDPPRQIPAGRHTVVSPADGKVTDITAMDQAPFIDGPAVRIGIFLSVFDVHVNRAPFPGKVTGIEATPGKFLDARDPEAANVNNANTLALAPIRSDKPIMAVRQISGKIARRIVCCVQKGESLHRGQRIGMIKFGSRTELYIAATLNPAWQVSVGQKVFGGTTIVCRVDIAENMEN